MDHNHGQTLPDPSLYPRWITDPTGQYSQYVVPITDSRVLSNGNILSIDRSPAIPNQPQATQFLCGLCQGIFQEHVWHDQQTTGNGSGGTVDHHPTYDSFINAVFKGCYICVLLWERIPQDAKRVLPTLSSAYVLLKCNYQMKQYENSQLKLVEVYTNSAHDWALRPPGTNAIMVLLGSLTNDFPQYEPTVDAGPDTNSSAAWACIARWLENCSKRHASCRHLDQFPYASQYPTRLLDVGANDRDNNIKLVETNTVVLEGPYVTLSHCWGLEPVTSLTKATKQQFLLELPAVPKTFGDAIVVARKLHIRYLWIDSLCIIQDDPEDWQTESLLMDQVYKNALLNIAATAASDSCGGLFHSRPHLVPCCQVKLGGKWFRFIDTSLFIAEVENSPLLQRAWVLQERLLAPRVLHFGRKQLFWECNELCASETFPDGQPPGGIQNDTQQLRARIRAMELKSKWITKGHELEVLKIWRSILSLYTRSNLTFGTDKLRALAGITKHIQPLFGNTYRVGIWQDSIILLLGWYCFSGNLRRLLPRPVEYRAPTWSWASTDNPITFWLPFPRSETVFDLKVLAFETATIGDDTAMLNGSGYLLVEGPLNLVTIDKYWITFIVDGGPIVLGRSDHDGPWLDEDTELPMDLYCLPLHHTVVPKNRKPGEYDDMQAGSVDDEDTCFISFLLLKPASDYLGFYTRCGVWRSEGTEGLLHVQTGCEAPCQEFIGVERGHRIRIY